MAEYKVIKKIELDNKVEDLYMRGLNAADISKELCVSIRTIERSKSRLYKKLRDTIKDRDSLILDIINADIKARNEAWKNYLNTVDLLKKDRWHKQFIDANKNLADKLMRWGIAPEDVKKLEIKSDTAISINDIQEIFKNVKGTNTGNK